MKRIMLTALALAVMIVPMAGCSKGGNSCKDACDKINSCGLLGVSLNECNTLCEDTATDQEIDCVVDSSCGNLNRC